MTKKPLVSQIKDTLQGNPDGLSELFLFRGNWFAPNPGFCQLIGEFGELHVRNVVGNSTHDINPATLSQSALDVLRKVCKQTKKAGVFKL
jgi:hypothetical protein